MLRKNKYTRLMESGIETKSVEKLARHFQEIETNLVSVRGIIDKFGDIRSLVNSLGSAVKKGDGDAEEHYVEVLHSVLKELSKFKYIADDLDKMVRDSEEMLHDKF